MSINPVASTTTIPPAVTERRTTERVFTHVLDAKRSESRSDTPLSTSIDRVRDRLAHGREVSPAELITYQVQVQNLSLRVELCSRLAECLVSTVKKLQVGQQ